MFGIERTAVIPERDPCLAPNHVGEREVGGVATLADGDEKRPRDTPFDSAASSRVSREIPSHLVSYLDHLVTQ